MYNKFYFNINMLRVNANLEKAQKFSFINKIAIYHANIRQSYAFFSKII